MQLHLAIMLLMGILAFLVLLFLLIWSVLKEKPYKNLLFSFLIPIVMIGYPTIKSITIGEGGVEIITATINTQAKLVYQNPNNTLARDSLVDNIKKLKSINHFDKSEKALMAVANAQIALGRYDSAAVYLKKTKKIAPRSEELKGLKVKLDNKIDLQNKFSKNIKELDEQFSKLKQSHDKKTIYRIAQNLTTVEVPVYVQPEDMVVLAKSFAITGNKKRAVEIINKLDSKNTPAKINTALLKDSIQKELLYSHMHTKVQVKPAYINNSTLDNVVIKKK